MSVGSIRAPQAEGSILALPQLDQIGELIRVNRAQFPRRDPLRELARTELLTAAQEYTTSRGEPLPPPADSTCFLLAGHQPELFHPGVWAKNFALCGMARRLRVTAVNLLIDNDTVKSTALRYPLQLDGRTVLRSLPFDPWHGGGPWEERQVMDPACFAAFGETMAASLRTWGYEPLIADLWPRVLRLLGAGNVGEALAAARREIERAWGCHNLEVPLSAVCRGEAFAWFVRGLLADLPRFVGTYNQVVREHRRRHKIRSKNHPVPDLARDGEWLEMPLWAWETGGRRRARVFARSTAGPVEIRAGEWRETLPPLADTRAFLAAWRGWEGQGLKVRSRALTTTLFARLFLADVFVHGIGGGKYDALTDELMRRFFGVEPPQFAVLSGTCRLPLPRETVPNSRHLRHRLRDYQRNPQRHVLQAAERLRQLIAWQPTSAVERDQRYRAFRTIREECRPAVAEEVTQLRAALRQAEEQERSAVIRQRRDYSLALYPESTLRPFLTQLL